MRRPLAASAITAGLAGTAIYQSATVWAGTPYATGGFVVAAMLAAAAFGVTRRSVVAQVAARGTIFVGATPFIVRVASGGAPSTANLVGLLLAASALWLARPMLDTPEARAEFAPARFRSAFLAGATTATGAAIAALAFAIVGLGYGSALMVGFNGGLALVLLLAVRGLLKMRTWGLLLGAFASLVCLALTPFYGAGNAVTLSLAAAPALLLWVAPLWLARRTKAEASRVRVAIDAIDAEPATRVADDDELVLDDVATPQRRAVSR